LDNLQDIRGKLSKNIKEAADAPEVPLLSYDDQGYCHVLPLEDAKVVLDWVWDNAFQYNGTGL
jgi:hypothetical protein